MNLYKKLYRIYRTYKRFRDFIKREFFLLNGKHTDKKKVTSLIKKLYPYQTQKKLIRVGLDDDGGYLLPNDLKDLQVCFSAGVGSESNFDLECSNYGMTLFLADNSVSKPTFNSLPPNPYHFLKKHIGLTNNADFITLDEWVNSSGVSKQEDLLLKMDIEGAEYDVLNHCSDELMTRVRIFVVEIHDLYRLWREDFFHNAERMFDKILKTHACVHIHPNNYDIIYSRNGIPIPITAEFTFLRRDRIDLDLKNHQTKFPHDLDFDNCPDIKHITVPKNWYSNE